MQELIGRFQVIREIGKGSQGAVYLALDPHLQRQVALKTLRVNHQAQSAQSLLDEARMVSQLQHPNIITLFDAIEHDDKHYLVLEYVEGVTLESLLQSKGAMEKLQAVKFILQLLEGVGYAHSKKVIHRDIKPSNILIDNKNVARIMDFGIARKQGNGANSGLDGTLRYMAPEHFENQTVDYRADLFSLGAVMYEMLTGQTIVSGNNLHEVAHKLANVAFKPPSGINSAIDERLDGLVMRALAKKSQERYDDAAAMKKAFENYLRPEGEAPRAGDKQGILDFLIKRMRYKSDFPALSQSISVINQITSKDEENVSVLSDTVLKDFSLTNKLLRLVNSVTYGQFGGTISTISRAILILGFDAVRSLALTIILFDHLQNKAQASDLKEAIARTYLSGLLAQNICQQTGVHDVEQGFICATFHRLGKLLTTFYFHEEMQEINKLLQKPNADEAQASNAVLGISFEELGIGVAKAWHFPEIIISTISVIKEQKIPEPTSVTDRMRLVAQAASTLCDIAVHGDEQERQKRMKQFNQRFGTSLGLSEKQLIGIVDQSTNEFLSDAVVLHQDTRNSGLIKNIKKWTEPKAATGTSTKAAETPKQLPSIDDVILADKEQPLNITADGGEAILTAGIQDITNTLVGDFDLNSVLRMILETMYRAMGFRRVLLCLRDMRANTMVARFGLGESIDRIQRQFVVPLDKTAKAQDVFQVAIEKGADIFIQDTDAENIRSRIPDWYRKNVASHTFILLPITIDKKAIGMLYADKEHAGSLVIEPASLNLLKTLRNQAVLAIRQKH